jgi:hypothetical protein
MFRTNLLLNRSRLLPLYRSFCQPPRQKVYIIRLKDGDTKLNEGSQILKLYQQKQQKSLQHIGIVQWTRVIEMTRKLLVECQQRAVTMIKKSKIPEMITDMKNRQIAKIEVKKSSIKKALTVAELKKLPGQVKEALIVVRSSEGFKIFLSMPSRTVKFSKFIALQTYHYWNIFMQSKFKDQLVKIIIIIWINAVKITKTVVKFIYEAYFEKPKSLK